MDWSQLNSKYVLPARRHLLGGRAAQGEEMLRQGLEETGDGWLAYQLAEALLFISPEDPPRIEEACRLLELAVGKVAGDLHRRLAETALDRARAMLALAPKREGRPQTMLPAGDPVRAARPRPRPVVEEEPPPPDPMVEKLKSLFGFESFRPGQRETIETLLKGRSAVAVMPPGSGKSLVVEFAAKSVDGATVVVSGASAKGAVLQVTVEEFAQLQGERIALLVIDEADRLCEWGHRLTRAYAPMRELIGRSAPGVVLALTAVATPRVRAEIIERLGMAAPHVQVGSFDRRNLVWSVIETRDRMTALRTVLAERTGAVVVRTQRRSDAEAVAAALKEEAARVQVIAGDAPVDRRDVRAVVHWQMPASLEQYYVEATEAGRDGEPANAVILHDADDKGFHRTAIEQTYPDRSVVVEVLDAVIERRPLEAILSMRGTARGSASLELLEAQGFIRAAAPGQWEERADAPNRNRLDTGEFDRRRRQAEERLRAMERYVEARGCRRMEMLAWFGERPAAGWQCAGCDRCRAAREGSASDAGVVRQAVVMGVRELEGRRFSINEMSRAMLFLAPPHVTRPLKGKSEAEVRDVINALLREGAIELDGKGQFVRGKR